MKLGHLCMSESDKLNLHYLIAVAGYTLEQAMGKLDEPSIYDGNLLDAASVLFDECYLPSVPDNIKYYIDYEKIARDYSLGGDMCEFEYAGKTYTCTNANKPSSTCATLLYARQHKHSPHAISLDDCFAW